MSSFLKHPKPKRVRKRSKEDLIAEQKEKKREQRELSANQILTDDLKEELSYE